MEGSSLHNIEAEACLLGCIMREGAILDEVNHLNVSSFYNTAHGLMFGALVDLHKRGEPTGPAMLREELICRGQLDAVGGAEYIGTCFVSVAATVNASWYARQIEEKARLRRVMLAAQTVLTEIDDPLIDPDTVVSHALECFQDQVVVDSTLTFPRINPQESPAPVTWLLSPLFPAGCLCGLQGDPGSGKSYLMLDACLRGALGQSWIDEATDPMPTMFVDCERSHMLALKRIHELTMPEDRDKLDDFHYVFPTRNQSGLRFFPLDQEANRRGLLDAILRCSARLVVIDSLSRLWGGLDPNLDGAVMAGWLREIVDNSGATIVLIHHVAKGDPKYRSAAPHIRDWRGSGALPAGLDVQLAMVCKGDHYLLHVLRSVWRSGAPRWSLSRDDVLSHLVFTSLEGRSADKADGFEGFLRALVADGGVADVRLGDLQRQYSDRTKDKIGDETARKVLLKLVDEGLVRRGKMGRTWIYTIGGAGDLFDENTPNDTPSVNS